MAGTTGLEPATSAVTAKRKVVTYRKHASRMASFGAVRNDQEPLSNPYQTHDLCPVDLCLSVKNRVAHMLARVSTLTKRAAVPYPWTRPRRAGFATIHRRTWRPASADRPPVFRDQSQPFENILEPFAVSPISRKSFWLWGARVFREATLAMGAAYIRFEVKECPAKKRSG
jgi:hypothetical protein